MAGRYRRALSPPNLALAGAAFLFGTTFLVMQRAVEEVEPIPYLAVRFGLGALVLLPLAWRRAMSSGASSAGVAGAPLHGAGHPLEAASPVGYAASPRRTGLVKAGVSAGLALGVGYVFQTVGLQYTTTSVSAFVTYLLVVFVPLLAAVVLRRPPPAASVAGVALAVVGLVLLTTGDGLGVGRGELLTLGCAFAFAVHILVLGDVAARYDVMQLNVVQFLTVFGLLVVPGALFGGYRFTAEAWLAVVYTGVVVTALAFGLQVWGQRQVSPTRTALILLLEPVFAALLGFAVGERLGLVGLVGAALIIVGIVVSEVASPVVPRPEDP